MSPQSNTVLDLPRHGTVADQRTAVDGGILSVIRKATQGRSGADPSYRGSRTRTVKDDVVWGTCHLGTASDGVGQAENRASGRASTAPAVTCSTGRTPTGSDWMSP